MITLSLNLDRVSSSECTELDCRSGLTFLKYLAPVNWTMPDDVRVVNATMVDFMIPSSTTHIEQGLDGEIVARLLGFIRPPKIWKDAAEILHVCASSKTRSSKTWSEW